MQIWKESIMVQREPDGWKSQSKTIKSLTWKKLNKNWKKEEIPGKNNQKENKTKTSSDQLKRQQDQCSTNNIESVPFHDTLAETLDAISKNNFDKDLETIITNSSATDQQPDYFLS